MFLFSQNFVYVIKKKKDMEVKTRLSFDPPNLRKKLANGMEALPLL